jgi:hypothetical protein
MGHINCNISDKNYEYLKKIAKDKAMDIDELASIVMETICEVGLDELDLIE